MVEYLDDNIYTEYYVNGTALRKDVSHRYIEYFQFSD